MERVYFKQAYLMKNAKAEGNQNFPIMETACTPRNPPHARRPTKQPKNRSHR